ncbi:hypothetical protein PIROE2DRAFT_13692, partial [Piromyces sp. E2]
NSKYIDNSTTPPKNKTVIPKDNKIIKNKRSDDGSNKCRPLPFKNKSLSINCYFEVDNGLIVCNELTARQVFLFYLPKEVSNEDYGHTYNDNSLYCNLEHSKIREWSLWHYESGVFQNVTQFNLTRDHNEDMKYHFTLIFDNSCVYNLPVERVQTGVIG